MSAPVRAAGVPTTAREARELAATWLSRLRRDERGLPVPWINRWGEETIATTRIEPDLHVGGQVAVFHDDHGDVPDFTRQNMGRQRQAMTQGLCQVCGRFVPWSRRNLVLAGATVEMVDLGGRRVAAVHEPWLDDRCAAIATLLCPALIRRSHEDNLSVLAVRSPSRVQVIMSTGRVDVAELVRQGQDEARGRQLSAAVDAAGGEVAMWVKLLLPHQRIEVIAARSAAAPV